LLSPNGALIAIRHHFARYDGTIAPDCTESITPRFTSQLKTGMKVAPDESNLTMASNQNDVVQKDCHQEQISALLQAVSFLSEMASTDTSPCAASQSLDALQSQWKLEDTQIPQLRDKILRLKSTSHVLQQDADSHLGEMQSLHQELQSSNARIQELNMALCKLHKRNQRLQHHLEQQKQERKSLVKSVKKYIKHMNRNEEHQRLFCHEWLLQHGSKDHMILEDDLSSVASSTSSVSTATSLVTDDGIATVRFSPAIVEEAAHDYDLSFPRGTKIGLQFHKVEKKPLLSERAFFEEKESALKHFKDSFRVRNHDHGYYVVCGHYGFDRDLNTLPALGARLVKVNGEPVGNLTLDRIKESIKCMDDCEFFTMTFCNEPLTPKQEELLQQAINITVRKYEDNQEEEHFDSSKPDSIDMHALEDGVTNRLTSFLQSARNRTFSDSAVDIMKSERLASSDGPASESTPASRLSSFLQGAHRSRIDSDPTVDISERSERDLSSSDDIWGSLETPGNRLSSFLNSASRVRIDSDPVVDSTLDVVNHGTPSKAGGTGPVVNPDTSPSLKLKQSMKTMGTKFKSLF
jgi:hypothetical protein